MSDDLDSLRVGPITEGRGNAHRFRSSMQRELVVQMARGRLHEAALWGNLFIASTAVAGVAPGTALSTTPPLAIYNPINSGKLVSIQQVFLGYVSGTLGGGSMVHAHVATQAGVAPTGGAELVPVPGLLSNIRPSARVYQGATLAAVPTIVRPSFVLGAGLASTATLPMPPAMDEVDGGIIVPPGVVWCFQGIAAAGTTPLVLIGVVYEELPIG